MTTNANDRAQRVLCTRHQLANMHEQPLRLVPPRRVAFVLFGPSDLVRCRTSFSQVESHVSTLSILERALYKRQTSMETGKPFLLPSVYTAADVATFVKQDTVPFVQHAMKHSSTVPAVLLQFQAHKNCHICDTLTTTTKPTSATSQRTACDMHLSQSLRRSQ